MKRIIINVVKILIVAGLVVYVLSNIQWRDTLTYLNTTTGEVERVVVGEILGDWDTAAIQFLPADTKDVIEVESDAKDARISPGLFTYFRNLDIHYFWIGVGFTVAGILFSAVRWWWLLGVNKLNVTLFDSIRYTWLGMFFNNVIPGQTGGDIVKAIYIARRCRSGPVPAFLSVFVDRVLGLTSLALLAALIVLFSVDRFFELAIAIWALLLAGVVIASAFFSRRLRQRIGLKYLALKLPAKVQNLLKEVDSAIFLYRGHKKGISVWLLLGMVSHFVLISGVVMFGFAIGVGIPVQEYYVLVPVINIVSAIPIAPSGWGIGEALYAKLFADYGAIYLADTPNAELVMSTRGIALSILFRIVLTALSLLGGLALLFEKQRLSKEEIKQQAHL